MILYHSALQAIDYLARRQRDGLGKETRELRAAVGSVLAEDIVSPLTVPPFANSAMDGFAVRAAETERSLSLRVAGSIAAGDPPPFGVDLPPGFAFEIMTGAPVPDSFDAVVKVEETASHQTGHGPVVTLARAARPGENVRRAGEDFTRGQAVIRAGTLLRPEHVLVLATLGIAKVRVQRRVRIAVISTGPELVELGSETPLAPGQIYNSSGPYLDVALPALCGAEVSHHGTVADEIGGFLKTLDLVRAQEPDIVLTTGAVSMGKHDFIVPALREARAEILFHKVSIRPGKPILLAEFGNSPTVFFGLPGNAVSTAVGARFFVEPYVRALQGRPLEHARPCVLANAVEKPEGLRCFFKGRLDSTSGMVHALEGQGSSLVSPLGQANCWVILDEGRGTWRPGDRVAVVGLVPALDEAEGTL